MVQRLGSTARASVRVAFWLVAISSCSVFGLSEDELKGGVANGGASGADGSNVTGGTWANGGSSAGAGGAAGSPADAAVDGSAGADAAIGGAAGNPGGGGAGGAGGSGGSGTGGTPPCPFPGCFGPGAACGDNCECCSTDCKDQLCN